VAVLHNDFFIYFSTKHRVKTKSLETITNGALVSFYTNKGVLVTRLKARTNFNIYYFILSSVGDHL